MKPRLFISHASHDGNLADAIKKEIEKVFAKGVDVFCTSSPGSIQASEDWLQRIENNLSTTQAVIVIVTSASITRPWLWFEIGATWLKGRTGGCKIYPICAPEINLGDLPPPLDRLQAISMGNPAHLKQFFQALIQQFNFGNISSFRADNIIKWLPEYIDVDASDTTTQKGLLTAPTPDVRVSAKSGYALPLGGEPVFLLAIQVQNYSPVVIYINNIYIEAQNNSILVPETDFRTGEYQRPRELQPGKSLTLNVNPVHIQEYLSKGLKCAATQDQIGRIYRSSEEEFSRAIDLLFNYYLKSDESS
jgi:hypothetical protein